MPGAPHETWLVIDATTGQNAVQQVKAFSEVVKVTLAGVTVSTGILSQTTRVTGIMNGELVALGLVMLIVAE